MNKLIENIKSINKIRKALIIVMLIQMITVGTAYTCNIEMLTKTDRLLDLINPIVFTLVMLAYSYYIDNQFKGIICMTLAMGVNLIKYLCDGHNLYDSFALCGFELPLSLMGIILMLIISMYKDPKTKDRKSLVERFSSPKYVKTLYKLMVYCTLFSVFVTVFNNNNFQGVTNIELKTLVILQALLPTFIMIGYITLTDIAYPIMIFYNIVYVVMVILVCGHTDIEIINIIYATEFTLVMGYVTYCYKRYIKERKGKHNGSK